MVRVKGVEAEAKGCGGALSRSRVVWIGSQASDGRCFKLDSGMELARSAGEEWCGLGIW